MAVSKEELTLLSPEMGTPSINEFEHPREEGVFNYTTEIHDIQLKNIERPDQHGNVLSRYRVVFDDGVKLGVNHYHAAEAKSDVPILQTPAWMTGLHGHNQISQHKLAEAGFDSLLIGHVGEERDSWAREIGNAVLHSSLVASELQDIHLGRQAHHMLSVHKVMGEITGLSTTEANVFGESRGAMTGLGVVALASKFDTKINKAMLISPCFETGVGEEVLTELLIQLPSEVVGMVGAIGHVSFNRLVRSASTINLSPKSLLYEMAHGPTLFRGDAGKFVEHIPKDQHIKIIGFRGDFAGQTYRWARRFKGFPNVIVKPAPKAHISGIVDERTMRATINYFSDIPQIGEV